MRKLLVSILFLFSLTAYSQCLVKEVTVVLNKGNKYTNTTVVSLSIKALHAKEFKVSNHENFQAAAWRLYTKELPTWEIKDEEGDQTVYVRFKDEAGIESETFTASVYLDRMPPENPYVKINYDKDAYHGSASLVDLTLSASDADYMMLSNSETYYGAKWETYQPDYKAWSLAGESDGVKKVYAKFRDRTGNISGTAFGEITIDTKAPVRGTIFINNGQNATRDSTGKVQIALNAIGADEMMVSNSVTFEGAEWQPYKKTANWVLAKGEGMKTVFVKFRDKSGNQSQTITATILQDYTPPKNCNIAINNGAGETSDIDNIVRLNINAPDAKFMIISNSVNFARARWTAITKEIPKWTLLQGLGEKTVFIRFRDEIGNETGVYQATIMVKK
ncbi:MAG: hypothetical protein EAZ97_02070 [Bacteroidetes bacterium]|nr:MAG: hypothetical protein EAZ97_02070 [Bacteroidota bacterium]